MTPEWAETRVRFRYSLSDFCLFTRSFRGRSRTWPLAPATHVLPEPEFDPGALAPAGDFICLRNYPIARKLRALRVVRGSVRYAVNQCYGYYIDLGGTFDGYTASLSPKSRKNVRREVKKLADADGGVLDCRLYTAPAEMPEYHRLAREVAVKTYQERLFDGAIPEGDTFQRELCRLAAAGRVRGLILFMRGKPISYLYLPITDGVVEYTHLGYDPEFAELSPGKVLLYLALEKLFAERRFAYFDLGYGASQTKEVFCTGKYLRADIYYFPLRHVLAVCGHAGMDFFSGFCGRALDRLGLRQAVRKALRSA